MEMFLRGFVEKHPEFQGRELFITGESYAGHYIPAIAHHLLFSAESPFPLTLKGLAIGNGWVDPYLQYPMYAKYAYENKLIGQTQYYLLLGSFKLCTQLINSYTWLLALETC